MKNKNELCRHIENKIHSIHKSREELNQIVNSLKNKFNIPADLAMDLVGLKYNLLDQTDEVLFYLCRVLIPNQETIYFNNTEIKTYESRKFKVKTIKFPLKFKMIQVTQNQWIGATDVKQLIMFRDAQLINYNENAQRTLTKVVREGIEYYKISLNRNALNEIKELFLNGSYIPNTITLNMPETADYFYNEETNELVIRELEQFDILDGYHRYITMSKIYNSDKQFNYPMTLQIVAFSEQKARQFIFQEDQKTKMSKVDSDSFNQNNHGNQVINLLNQEGILAGQINNKDGILDESTTSQLINAIFFNEAGRTNVKKIRRKDELLVRNSIQDKITAMINRDPDLLDKKWDREFLASALYLTSREDVSVADYGNEVKKLYSKLQENKEKFPTRTFTKREITRLQKIYDEEEGDSNV